MLGIAHLAAAQDPEFIMQTIVSMAGAVNRNPAAAEASTGVRVNVGSATGTAEAVEEANRLGRR
jgi:hypothetical protein